MTGAPKPVPLGTTMAGRCYLDPGDRLSGRKNPPEPVTVLTRWGPGGGPRNVLVRRPGGALEVIPFPRRLRRLDPATAEMRDQPHE